MSISAFNNYDTDIVKRYNSDFSITERLHEYIRKYDWQAGYNDVLLNNLPRDSNGKIRINDCPENAAYWLLLSATFEPIASEIYEKIDSMVKRTVDIDVCNINSLYSISDMLGVAGVQNVEVDYPLEIKSLLEIFSTNKSRVLFANELLLQNNIDTLSTYISASVSNTLSGYDLSATTFVRATSSLVNDWSSEQISAIQSLSSNYIYDNYDLYIEFMERQFYTVLMNYINDPDFLQDYYDKIYVSKEKTADTILDTESDELEINELKVQYNISENFSAKLEADNIIAGRKHKNDYTVSELKIIEAEIKRRENFEKYGSNPLNESYRRFRYEQERKFREYILFVENINIINKTVSINNSYSNDLMEIDIDDYKFFDYYNDVIPPLTGGVPVSGDMIESAVHYLRNLSLETFYRRERIRTSAQKLKHIGTSQIIEFIISDYLYKNFSDRDSWNLYEFPELSAFAPYFSGIALGGEYIQDAVFNNVRVIEYVDETEYFNIANPATSGDLTNARYWENESIVAASDATSTDFYKFYKNIGIDGTYDSIKTFIDQIHEMGAVSATIDTLTADVITNPALTGIIDGNLSGMHRKYFGNVSGDIPWVNTKNQIHPSIALHPYLWALQEYGSLVFTLASIYNNTVKTEQEHIESLSGRIDENGSLINLWQADAVTMGSYEDFYQHSSNLDRFYSENEKIDYDGPFIFEALQDYLERNSFAGLSTTDINEFFTEWYGHLLISQDLETKIKWQLENHVSDIISMANKKIYQFAVDKYGTQYILFKDTLNYYDTGEMWIRYKNHPLAFPLSKKLTSTYQQIDITSYYDEYDNFYNASKQVYDFNVITLSSKTIIVAHTAGPDLMNPIPSRSGVVYYASVKRNAGSDNEFYVERLEGNNWYYNLDSDNAEYIGVYDSSSFDGDVFGVVSRLGYTSSEIIAPDGSGNYNWIFRFRIYDDFHGITYHNKNIITKYPLYDTNDPTDYHNRFRLNRFSDKLSIIFESENISRDNSPYLYNGTGNNGKFNAEYNVAKQMYHNGFTLIDYSMGEEEPYPSSYVVTYYNGYNDVGYHSVEAWEGYIGSEHPLNVGDPVGQLSTELQQYTTNDDNYIGIEFLGMSDPSTSARFDIDNMQFLCYNSNEEYLGLYVSNIYPTWGDAQFAWSDTISAINGIDFTKWVPLTVDNAVSGDYYAWDTKTWLYKLFTEPDQTAHFATLGSDNIYYNVTVTYKGRGCQKFQVSMEANERLNSIALQDFVDINPRYFVYATHYGLITAISGVTSGTLAVDLLTEHRYNIFNVENKTVDIRKDGEYTISDARAVIVGNNGPNEILINVDDVTIYTLNERISLTETDDAFLLLETDASSVLLLEEGSKLILET